MAHLEQLLQALLHIDTTLVSFVTTYGVWAYGILFAIIFCETGFVIFPFLPGDSLLFAAGSIAAKDNILSIQLLFVLLTLASILGNKLNYTIGRLIGPRVFRAESSWFFNKDHLIRAHQFYETHGGKTIIFARFIPIIRSFVPFVAGVGSMNLAKFSYYNIVSALLWIGSLLFAGYFFGSLPIVRDNFSIVIYSIIVVSLLPPTVAYFYKKFA